MNYMDWTKDMLSNKQAQEILEKKIEYLVSSYFDKKEEYAIEKLIKSFGEGIRTQEVLLLKNRGLHSSQLQKNMIKLSMHPEETAKMFKEVESILISEIERQFRHFNTFLSAVRTSELDRIINQLQGDVQNTTNVVRTVEVNRIIDGLQGKG